MESLSLNFTKIMYTPTPLDKSGPTKKGDGDHLRPEDNEGELSGSAFEAARASLACRRVAMMRSYCGVSGLFMPTLIKRALRDGSSAINSATRSGHGSRPRRTASSRVNPMGELGSLRLNHSAISASWRKRLLAAGDGAR